MVVGIPKSKKFFRNIIYRVNSSQWVQNLLKIALSVIFFEIVDIFDFHQNSTQRPEFGKVTISQRYISWHPKSPKFVRNRSISKDFQDNRKIQHGSRNLEK